MNAITGMMDAAPGEKNPKPKIQSSNKIPNSRSQALKKSRHPHQAPPLIPILFFACLLRLAASFNAFWFDEIWSWEISRTVHSAWQILTLPLAWSDNNHPLNTLWMYLIGNTSSWLDYRIPSLVTGIAMVLLIVWMERKRGGAAAILACLLVGLNFPLITYSSEARGYAPMLLCAIVAYYLLRRFLNNGRRLCAAAFAVVCSIGPFWHLTFVHFLFAAFVWSAIVLFKKEKFARAIGEMAMLYAVPALVFLGYAWIFLRHVHIGGAPTGSVLATLASTFSLLLGGAIEGGAAAACAVVTVIAITLALTWLWKKSRDEAVFFLFAIAAVPALTLLAQWIFPNSSPSIQVRYLLVSLTFALLLLIRFGAAMIALGGWRRNICIAVVALAMLGNGVQLGQFLAVGRGDYRDALRKMADQTTSKTITWSTDTAGNAYRIRTLLAYYQRFLPPGKQMQQIDDPTIHSPEWLIFNSMEPVSPPLRPISIGSRRYLADGIYPAYGLSGWTWVIYRESDLSPEPRERGASEVIR